MMYRIVLAVVLVIWTTGCEKKSSNTAPIDPGPAATASDDGESVSNDSTDNPTMAFSLSSSAFANDDALPTQFTCDGQGISPPLSWAEAPDGTESFAIVMTDPDAPSGTYHHWGIWAIPGEEHVLTANVPHTAEVAVTTPDTPDREVTAYQAKNQADKLGYAPACPPPGDDAHRYVFEIFALDHPGTTFPEPPSVERLRDELAADAIGRAKLTGTYQRSK